MNADAIVNKSGIKLARINAGDFWMGSIPNEAGRDADEAHRHKVTISSDFLISIHPTTQRQFYEIMGFNYSKFSGENNPVETVSKEEAQDFCRKLTEEEGVLYTLPSEAQWEYCCRAGSETVFCFGNDASQLNEYAWFENNAGGTTHAVGSKKPNAWGLYDMMGNVWEWCRDMWHPDGYADGDSVDPVILNGYTTIIRGGCYYSNPQALRSANRFGYFRGNRFSSVGFRVVCELK